MRLFKWTPKFHIDIESSIVPIWVNLPNLPLQFFDKAGIFLIGHILGTPIKMDAATALLSRLSVANISLSVMAWL